MSNTVLEDLLVNNLKIFVDKDAYNFTSDATILAEFVEVKPNQKIVEACAGSGVVSLLLTCKGATDILCIEIQSQMAQMCQKSVTYNNLDDKIKVVCDDFQNSPKYLREVDVLVCNPPYYKPQREMSKNPKIRLSKFESTMSLQSFVATASKILRSKGILYMCYDTQRFCELVACLQQHNLTPKQILFAQKDINSKPSCVFVKAVKDGNSGMQVLPVLITHDQDGKFLLTTKKMFEDHKKLTYN